MSTAGKILTHYKLTPEAVVKRVSRAQKKVLFKQGAYLRKTMQRSMRYATKRKQHSAPGEPPRAHKDGSRGPLLRQLISFFVDLAKGSVICGPMKFNSGQSVPQLLDQGGLTNPLSHKPNFKVGGRGPIRYDFSGRPVIVKLQTEAQTQLADQVATDSISLTKGGPTKIAARPFTKPIMSDGGKNFRKLIADTKV